MKEPLVCIILLNMNGRKWLELCLGTISRTSYKNYKIILTDNGSIDDSVEYAKTNYPDVDVLALGKNFGFAGGNNRGTKYALEKYKPRYILLLNNDIEIKQLEWLSKMVELAESDEKIGIVGCKLFFPSGKIQHAGGFVHPIQITGHFGTNEEDKGQYDYTKDVDYVTGACFLIKNTLIEKIGLLDEGYSPIYFEETDYCLTAKKSGFRIVYTGTAYLIHHTSATTKTETNENRYYIWEKNRLRFIMRNFPILWKFPALSKSMLNIFVQKGDSGLVFSRPRPRSVPPPHHAARGRRPRQPAWALFRPAPDRPCAISHDTRPTPPRSGRA
ncbi:glycosyltransferase family 2 protein, partial [Candidatus Micrarchaeota archaeon]|nr:glycosyltransferase family 2 protein [Candidatus Micrarchaeota archaeon]